MERSRLLLVQAPHKEELRDTVDLLRKMREQLRWRFTVFSEFFDPVHESPFRFRFFEERLRKLAGGHFQAVVFTGSVIDSHVADLIKAIPEGTRVGNFATVDSDLDREIQRLLGARNSLHLVAHGLP